MISSAFRFLILLICLTVCQGAQAQTSSQIYGNACRDAIGPVPAFSCADGVTVPITVDGVPVANPKPGMSCDRPALLSNGAQSDGQCVPNSRILSLSTDAIQISVMCRQKHIRAADSMEFDEIDVIAHKPATGATCWFQATSTAGHPVNGAHVSSPTEALNDSFWSSPQAVAHDGCGSCHDNDAFMYSPFVGQVWDKVPQSPFGPYFHVDPAGYGFAAWPTETFHPRDNTCIGCHRIGRSETCNTLTLWMTGRVIPEGADAWAQRFPWSHAMPPGYNQSLATWNTIYNQSVDQIRSCCQNPGQQACNLRKIGEGAD